MKTKQLNSNGKVASLQATLPSQNGSPDWKNLKKLGYPSLSYYQSIRNMTLFRMAWLHYKHPEWSIRKITTDILNWYAKEVPNEVRLDLKKFMLEEWKKKSYLEINAPSFDVLFEETNHA